VGNINSTTSPRDSQNSSRGGAWKGIVFDVGMNNGDDSAYYLSKGYVVVAVEANPALVQRARLRFEKQISTGQLLIEPVGISEHPGVIPFWINDERNVFSSFDRVRAARNGMPCHAVEIQAVTFDTLLAKYGVPYYMKLDIEGNEVHCLECLQSFSCPDYISVEAERLEFLQLLWQLGYRRFAIVDQMRHNSHFPTFGNDSIRNRIAKKACSYADRVKNRLIQVPFPRGCSGPFGEDIRAEWQSFEEVAYNWLHLYFGYYDRGTLDRASWYDFHAKIDHQCEQPSIDVNVEEHDTSTDSDFRCGLYVK
jgi:FkbM family methyltransferase